jgi:hypothetical protein
LDVSNSRPSVGGDLQCGDRIFEVKTTAGDDLTGVGGRWLEPSQWRRVREDPGTIDVIEVTRANSPDPRVRRVRGNDIKAQMDEENVNWDELGEISRNPKIPIHFIPDWTRLEGKDITPDWEPGELDAVRGR